jgi:hypothetical protein
MGYLSAWALRHFPERPERNAFYEKLGRELTPARETAFHQLNTKLGPDEVLALI